jgi:S1-C subfamily serine protease
MSNIDWGPESGFAPVGATPPPPPAGPPEASPPGSPPPPPPPPPQWIAAPHPWDTSAFPPPPPPLPPTTARSGLAGMAIGAAVALLLAVVGFGVFSRLHLHAARPTLSASSQPLTPLTPTNPFVPQPSTPASGGSGSTSGGAVSGSQASAIAAVVDPGVVDINTVLGYEGGSGAGTGMILTANGLVLTNNHVVDGATSISVTLVSNGRTFRASVVGTDPTQDIALIQLTGASGLSTIPLGNSSSVSVGDAVVAIGNAGGAGGTPAAVTGSVQAINQTITASDPGGANAETLNGLIQTDAPIQPGDSGGPLVSTAGKVIGMDTAASAGRRFDASASAGFAIPINQALTIARQIEAGPASSTIHLGLPGFLGVAVQSATAQGGFGSSSSSGAVITQVVPGSPAARAGLAAGDTITAFDGQSVDSPDTLTTLTRGHHPGDRVQVGWTDQAGASQKATITLATGPAD